MKTKTKTKIRTFIHSLAAGALALGLSSCGDKDKTAADPDKETGASTELESVMVAEVPEDALGVVEARAQAKPGEAITLRGKVGGKAKPISESVAILVLADEQAITSCNEIPGDSCETPWDFCCEDPSNIAASTATIQVRDADGQLVRSTLRGLGDLKELSHVVVSGTVDEASTASSLIVNANKIHVAKP